MAKTWFQITARANGVGEILIFDEITTHGGVSAKDFDTQLKALGPLRELTLRINSPGGDTMQASAIYNMLERLKAGGTRIIVRVEGVAASAASWIAMIGSEIIMPENTLMMIHAPSGLVVGDSEDMRSLAQVLDKIKQGMVTAYAAKSHKTRAEVEAIMDAETWYTAAEAVAAGFADRVEAAVRIAASFDLSRFAQPPKAPTTMDALARQYWAGIGKAVPANIAEVDFKAKVFLSPEEIGVRVKARQEL